MGQEARVRVVRKFIALLESNQYKYTGEDTTERLIMLIYTAMHSLSRIQADEWHKFLILFRQAKSKALAQTTTSAEKIQNYDSAVSSLRDVFEKYIRHVETLEA